MTAPTWEYHIERFKTNLTGSARGSNGVDDPSWAAHVSEMDNAITSKINDLGSRGWELVSSSVISHDADMHRVGDNILFIFKRPK